MLARFFHAWERRLAFATKDRVVRPFEWGTDWIHGTSADDENAADAAVERWVEQVMENTSEFFALPPTRDFAFADGTLTFPSALTTPHPENNIVSGRWFPAAGDESLVRQANRGRAVVVLPQWNSDAEGHIGLARVLARFGVSALRLSLPYHDARMPPELTRADYIVSSNIVRTVQVCRQAVLDARRAVAWLASLGFERIGIVGTSLGSCLSMLTSAHEPLIPRTGVEPCFTLVRRRRVARAVDAARASRSRGPYRPRTTAAAVAPISPGRISIASEDQHAAGICGL
jgi:hypothetical protein